MDAHEKIRRYPVGRRREIGGKKKIPRTLCFFLFFSLYPIFLSLSFFSLFFWFFSTASPPIRFFFCPAPLLSLFFFFLLFLWFSLCFTLLFLVLTSPFSPYFFFFGSLSLDLSLLLPSIGSYSPLFFSTLLPFSFYSPTLSFLSITNSLFFLFLSFSFLHSSYLLPIFPPPCFKMSLSFFFFCLFPSSTHPICSPFFFFFSLLGSSLFFFFFVLAFP